MLNYITIKDFAIIDEITLDFDKGLHVFTGETGSGKSIIIEAISLALGSRADTTYIQTGKDKAIVELSATIDSEKVKKDFGENNLIEGQELAIHREISLNGKSLSRVNGTIVTVGFLNNLCKNIADIHGQYDHQSLLDPGSHIVLLDSYNHAFINPLKQKVSGFYNKYSQLLSKRDRIIKTQTESARNRDFMSFELSEIVDINPQPGEDTSLEEQLNLLKNSETLFTIFSEVYETLYEQASSSHDSLRKSAQLLEGIKSFSNDYALLAEEVENCYYRIDDLRPEIRRVKDSIVFSQDAINKTQERIELLDHLKKKHGGTIEKVLEYKETIRERLSEIEDSENLLESLGLEIEESLVKLDSACNELSDLRLKTALDMEKDIVKELQELNFKNTILTVSISPISDLEGLKYTESGADKVEFLIITNKGENPKPLNKIASGGEISRIMLAFKSILGDFDDIDTLIFDEIDTGISGTTASIVGKKMKEIAKTHQVICITHLAQIAAFADHHYQISKDDSSGKTLTKVKLLDEKERIAEIARLLGGLKITDATLKNAEELILQSSQ